MDEERFTRRGFMTFCAWAAGCMATGSAFAGVAAAAEHGYAPARLTDRDGVPLRASDLRQDVNYIFHYPYRATPCFLLHLGSPPQATTLTTEQGAEYRWQGGVGPERTIVAFSAICAHKMTHPAPEVSFISYRADEAEFLDRKQKRRQRDGVIYCCSEKSVYDPARGAVVLGGPAPQPLAAIVLDYNEKDDTLTAVGTRGGEMFDRFFDKFGFRLRLEYETQDIRHVMAPTTPVLTLSEFTASRIRC